MKSGCNAYQTTKTMGMSQLDLILAVYSGTIGYLKQAKKAFQDGNLEAGRTACDRARKCVVHLYTTLDMDKGKEIAGYLGNLYAYVIEQLDLAVASKAAERFDDMIGVLTNLKEGWEGLKDNNKTDPAREEADNIDSGENPLEMMDSPASQNGQSRITFSA